MAGIPDRTADLIQIKEVQIGGLYQFFSSWKGDYAKAGLACGQGNFNIQPTLKSPEITKNQAGLFSAVTGPVESRINYVAV